MKACGRPGAGTCERLLSRLNLMSGVKLHREEAELLRAAACGVASYSLVAPCASSACTSAAPTPVDAGDEGDEAFDSHAVMRVEGCERSVGRSISPSRTNSK